MRSLKVFNFVFSLKSFKFMLKFKFYVLTETRDFIQNPGWDRRIVHSTEIYKVNCMYTIIIQQV